MNTTMRDRLKEVCFWLLLGPVLAWLLMFLLAVGVILVDVAAQHLETIVGVIAVAVGAWMVVTHLGKLLTNECDDYGPQ